MNQVSAHRARRRKSGQPRPWYRTGPRRQPAGRGSVVRTRVQPDRRARPGLGIGVPAAQRRLRRTGRYPPGGWDPARDPAVHRVLPPRHLYDLGARARGPAFLALLAAAGVLAVLALRRARSLAQYARLGLVLAAGVSVLAYTRSPAVAHSPLESARYLSCLPVSLPAALYPLWTFARRRRWLATGALVAVMATTLDATAALARSADRTGTAATRQAQLIQALDGAGVTRLYGGYRTCARLSYASGERVACAVVADDLRAGPDRVESLTAPVRADPRPAYALPLKSTVDSAFHGYLDRTGVPYTMSTAGGYHLYLLPHPIGVPLPG
jgi:hypothetical protein